MYIYVYKPSHVSVCALWKQRNLLLLLKQKNLWDV